jgi:DNA invertase Pin-like site-specific DNA recombinase
VGWLRIIARSALSAYCEEPQYAEFERDLIRERTAAGRMAAKSRGVRFGRPRKLNPQQAKLAKRLLEEGKLVSEIAETFGVHVATIYRLEAAQ